MLLVRRLALEQRQFTFLILMFCTWRADVLLLLLKQFTHLMPDCQKNKRGMTSLYNRIEQILLRQRTSQLSRVPRWCYATRGGLWRATSTNKIEQYVMCVPCFPFKFPPPVFNTHCSLCSAQLTSQTKQHALPPLWTQLTKQQKTHKSVKERKSLVCVCVKAEAECQRPLKKFSLYAFTLCWCVCVFFLSRFSAIARWVESLWFVFFNPLFSNTLPHCIITIWEEKWRAKLFTVLKTRRASCLNEFRHWRVTFTKSFSAWFRSMMRMSSRWEEFTKLYPTLLLRFGFSLFL